MCNPFKDPRSCFSFTFQNSSSSSTLESGPHNFSLYTTFPTSDSYCLQPSTSSVRILSLDLTCFVPLCFPRRKIRRPRRTIGPFRRSFDRCAHVFHFCSVDISSYDSDTVSRKIPSIRDPHL